MAMTISCDDMGYSCGFVLTGNSLDEMVAGAQEHGIALHNISEEVANSPEKIAEWKGAIKQTSRPQSERTAREDDPKPH